MYSESRIRDAKVFAKLEPTGELPPENIARVRSHLATPFRNVHDDDLSWLGFWIVLESAR